MPEVLGSWQEAAGTQHVAGRMDTIRCAPNVLTVQLVLLQACLCFCKFDAEGVHGRQAVMMMMIMMLMMMPQDPLALSD